MHLLSTEGDVCNRKDKTTTTKPTTLSATTQPVITTTVTKYVIPRSSQQPLPPTDPMEILRAALHTAYESPF